MLGSVLNFSLLPEIEGLAASFISFVIQNVMRSANVPHSLAQSMLETGCWMQLPPSFLVDSIQVITTLKQLLNKSAIVSMHQKKKILGQSDGREILANMATPG